MLYRIHAFAVVLFFLLGTGCSRRESIPVSDQKIEIPVQEFNKTTLYFYNKQYIQWKLDADIMRKSLSDTGKILVVPVRLSLYDSLGKMSSKVLADSGLIANSMQSYEVWGDVFIRTREKMVVRSQRLRWFKEKGKIESNTYVQIQTKNGDVLRGKGLDANEDFSRFKFISDVTGKFPDFKRRLENNEESIF
jgi:LPS export ABC transporter protein LptC